MPTILSTEGLPVRDRESFWREAMSETFVPLTVGEVAEDRFGGFIRADWVGRLMTRRLEDMVEQSAATTAPLLESAMVAGHIRTQDADALAHWIARIAMICLFAPPPGDLQDALDALLLPMLDPDRST